MNQLNAILLLAGISILFSCVSNVSYPDAMQKAIAAFQQAEDAVENSQRYDVLGRIYESTLQPDSAEFYYLQTFKEGEKNQNIYLNSKIYKALAELETQKGNCYSAYNYAPNILNIEDSIKKKSRTEVIGKINAIYNYQHTGKENQQLLLENQHLQNQVYLLIIGLLIITGTAILYTNYTREQKRFAQEQVKQLSMLKVEQYKNSRACILENEKKIAQLETLLKQTKGENNILKELIQSPKALLEIFNQKIGMGLNEKECLEFSLRQSEIYLLFHQAVHQEDKLKSISIDSWKQLQNMIDITYNNFTEQLYTLYPQISEHELRICYLIKIQIPTKNIAKTLCRSLSAISNSRVRLYKKIHGKEGKAEMLDKFILNL